MSSRASLRTRVREKVDEATAAFWSDTTINNALQESYNYYFGFILKLFEGYFAKIDTIDFDANVNGEYDLPADFLKVRLVSRTLQNDKVPLQYFERFDNLVSTSVSNGNYDLPTYRFRGNKIVFEPAPNFVLSDAIEIEYIQLLTPLSDSVDIDSQLSALPMAEDCIVLRTVCKLKGIEEMVQGGGVDADPFIKDLLSTEQNLKEVMEQRSVARLYVDQYGEDYDNSFRIW